MTADLVYRELKLLRDCPPPGIGRFGVLKGPGTGQLEGGGHVIHRKRCVAQKGKSYITKQGEKYKSIANPSLKFHV